MEAGFCLKCSEDVQIQLSPTDVSGPYDYGVTPSTKGISDFINKTGSTYEAGTNYVHPDARLSIMQAWLTGQYAILWNDRW